MQLRVPNGCAIQRQDATPPGVTGPLLGSGPRELVNKGPRKIRLSLNYVAHRMSKPEVGASTRPCERPFGSTQKSRLCDRGPLLREEASKQVRRRRARTLIEPDRAASKVLLELDRPSSCKRWPLHCTLPLSSDLQSVGHVGTWRYVRHSASVSERVTRPFAISSTSSKAIACTRILPSE
jgi:hypothetical protein